MTLIYVIAGIGVLIGLTSLMVFIYRAGKAKGKLESNNDCDKRILIIKQELAKKIYGDGLSHFPVNQPYRMQSNKNTTDNSHPAT
ncbi:MAG: hypothetical protein WA066_02940 [Candidatus Omnitrophota bacterium]